MNRERYTTGVENPEVDIEEILSRIEWKVAGLKGSFEVAGHRERFHELRDNLATNLKLAGTTLLLLAALPERDSGPLPEPEPDPYASIKPMSHEDKLRDPVKLRIAPDGSEHYFHYDPFTTEFIEEFTNNSPVNEDMLVRCLQRPMWGASINSGKEYNDMEERAAILGIKTRNEAKEFLMQKFSSFNDDRKRAFPSAEVYADSVVNGIESRENDAREKIDPRFNKAFWQFYDEINGPRISIIETDEERQPHRSNGINSSSSFTTNGKEGLPEIRLDGPFCISKLINVMAQEAGHAKRFNDNPQAFFSGLALQQSMQAVELQQLELQYREAVDRVLQKNYHTEGTEEYGNHKKGGTAEEVFRRLFPYVRSMYDENEGETFNFNLPKPEK